MAHYDGQAVAAKLALPTLDERQRRNMLRAARLQQSIKHPNVVQVLCVGVRPAAPPLFSW